MVVEGVTEGGTTEVYISSDIDENGDIYNSYNLNTFWSALGIVMQDLINENEQLKNKLRLIEDKLGL